MVKEMPEKDYENILTDKTRKQYNADEDNLATPSRKKRESIKDDRTTERKTSNTRKRKNGLVQVPIERSQTQRLMNVSRPMQPGANLTDRRE